MTKIAIVTSSVRPGRQSRTVADWVASIASQRTDAEFEVVDIADFDLPIWDEEIPPSFGKGTKPHTVAWSSKMEEFDGYVFVTAEYNHSVTGALKNALDYLYVELNNKAAGFVSYGSAGGARAVEHLRGILSEQQVAHVRNVVAMSLSTEFTNYTEFTPGASATASVTPMLDQLVVWSRAMAAVRAGTFAQDAPSA